MTLRIALFAITFVAGTVAGIATQQLWLNPEPVPPPPCPQCPSLTCPPAVSLNSFDADKINNKKGNFHLHNNISNVHLIIDCEKDSALIKDMLKKGL